MPKVKVIHVPASATSSITLNHHPGNAHRGSPTPVQQPVPEIDRVVKLPFKQTTHADGTVTAYAWHPDHVDANADLGRVANRSHADTVRDINGYGEPQSGKRNRVPFQQAPEKHATVSFSNDGGVRAWHVRGLLWSVLLLGYLFRFIQRHGAGFILDAGMRRGS